MKNLPAILLSLAILLSGKSAFAQNDRNVSREVGDSEITMDKEDKNIENASTVKEGEFQSELVPAEESVDNSKNINQKQEENSDIIYGGGSISGSNNGLHTDLPNPGNDPLD
jgi:hypothetical protein